MSGSFADRVKTRRLELELSQAALAKRAKVSQGTVAQIELGLNQGSGKIVDLAAALGVSPEWLLYGKNPPQNFQKNNRIEQINDYIGTADSNSALKIKYIQKQHWDVDYIEFIQAADESMSPTITIFDDVVFNRLETSLHENAIFVIKRASGSVIIRRAIMGADQKWIYRSDNLDKTRYSDISANIGDVVLGRVIWRGGGNSFNI